MEGLASDQEFESANLDEETKESIRAQAAADAVAEEIPDDTPER